MTNYFFVFYSVRIGGVCAERLEEFSGAHCGIFDAQSLLGRDPAGVELHVQADQRLLYGADQCRPLSPVCELHR